MKLSYLRWVIEAILQPSLSYMTGKSESHCRKQGLGGQGIFLLFKKPNALYNGARSFKHYYISLIIQVVVKNHLRELPQ